MILGYGALGGVSAGDVTPSAVSNVTQVSLYQCKAYDLYLSADASETQTTTSDVSWNYNTVLHAQFENSLSAGNVDFILENCTAILTKVRQYGTYTWTTIFSNPIDGQSSNLSFENFYSYCKGNNTEYEFALVPLLAGGIEGSYSTNTIYSSFDGIYIYELNQGYSAVGAVSIDGKQRNRFSSTVNTMTTTYPYVVYTSQNNYDTFTVNAQFYKSNIKESSSYVDQYNIVNNSFDFRDELNDFLTDGKPKIIKDTYGRIWLIAVTSEIKEDQPDYLPMVKTTFSVTQIGDASSQTDLENNGLISIS